MIEFIQYLMPHGERRPTTIERDPEVQRMYDELKAEGCAFEIEMLPTGQIHMDISRDEPEELQGGDFNPPSSRPTETVVLANAVVPNGPGMGEHIDALITTAHARISGATPA